jgi:hypothetical protein
MRDEAWENWLETSAMLLSLDIPEVCRPGVLENLQRNFMIAEKLFEFPLDDLTELAPIFCA